MARVRKFRGQSPQRELPRVELIPDAQEFDVYQVINDEITEIVSNMILLATKRGRPSSRAEEEFQDAA